MQDEDPLSVVAGHEPWRERGCDLPGDLVGGQASGGVEQPDSHELGDRVDQPGAADADRVRPADYLQLDRVVVDPDDLDRALGRTHPTADLRGLERRPRRRRSRERLGG